VEDAAAVERWVGENAAMFSQLSEVGDWLTTLWPLLVAVVDNKLLTQMEPEGLSLQLALLWMRGATYRELIELTNDSKGTKARGEDGRQRLSDSDVLGFVEGCLGFDCQLVVAAVGEFLADLVSDDGSIQKLNEFQKCLKYGLPETLAISVYESGFADRCIAQELTAALRNAGYEGTHVSWALASYREVFTAVLTTYPSYFEAVLDGL
jgi:hypothetical protein